MTIEGLILCLKRTPRRWELRGKTHARLRIQYLKKVHLFTACPVSAIKERPHSHWPAVAKSIGLSATDAWTLQQASDCLPGYDPALRLRLLQACGLSE